ncbi:M61 family peptidase [Alteromonas aestuariivivens]|uniref:M61 family peptidase n=1 Tax=Alteromonas aestuariivivens TaxID=1938339 RepID=A0A3D8M824_9ALTE|nr:PDZ domain-containing protein [Alteromonas aestuariivivens]RDV26021.1 M61 family peptidase [Alteromonas aestuariivivens]
MNTESPVIDYRLSVKSQSQHLFEVTMTVPDLDSESVTVCLPAWIPGSYMIRDFARNIITFEASTSDGEFLEVSKLDKQSWKITTSGRAFTLSYTVYAFDLSVRSAFINDEFAFCNGTSVFLAVKGHEQLPCRLQIIPPTHLSLWHVETSMPVDNIRESDACYLSKDYDELIDHPIFIGRCSRASFMVGDVEFVLLFSGSTQVDVSKISTDLVPICEHHLKLFSRPYPMQRYVFMTLLSDSGYGGLEHRSSTALLYPRFDLPLTGEPVRNSDTYTAFLSLCSHELFHTWHVKRIKPSVMIKPDLSAEVYTDQLWIYEGFTSFYDDVTLARAGVISGEKYLELVGQNLTRLQQTAGRNKQSVAESSFDAWTKFYKQDASATNNIVSYYNKGGIIALGLDLLLRRRSNNEVTLDNVMQILWRDYGLEQSGTQDNVIAEVCNSEFGIDITDYLQSVVYGTEDVPLQHWLSDIGIEMNFRPRQGKDDKGGTPPASAPHRHQLGASVKNAEAGVTVLQVREGLAACQAGIQINDRLVAFNGYVVNDALLQRLLDACQQSHAQVTVIREGRLLNLELPILSSREDVCYLTISNPDAFKQWLGRP